MSANFTPSQSAIKDMQPFRFWCQKVLPTVFDDSLSYYELLTKVVNYLNDTVDNVNTLNSNVQNIYNAYILLQNYVNSYFDQNIPQLVSDKLDEMAEDGTLTALIKAYIDPYFDAKSDEIEEAFDAQNERIDEAISDQNGVLSAQTRTLNQMVSRMDAFISNHSGDYREEVLFDGNGTLSYLTDSYIALTKNITDYKYIKIIWKHRQNICVQEFEVNQNPQTPQSIYLRDTNSAPAQGGATDGMWEMANINLVNASAGTEYKLEISQSTYLSNTSPAGGNIGSTMDTGIAKIIGVTDAADAEISDARVGTNGTIYPTLGSRLNAEYSYLYNDLINLMTFTKKSYDLKWYLDVQATEGVRILEGEYYIPVYINTGETYTVSVTGSTGGVSTINGVYECTSDRTATNRGPVTVGTPSQFTAEVDVRYISFFIENTNITADDELTFVITKTVNTVNSLEEQVDTISDKVDIYDSSLKSKVDNWDVLPNQIRANLVIGNNVASMILEQSTTFRFGVQGYDSETYTNRVYDSGWLTDSVNYVDNLNPNLYYMVVAQYANLHTYDLATIKAETDVYVYYNVPSKFSNIETKLDALGGGMPTVLSLSKTVKGIAHRGDDIFGPQCIAPAYILARKHGFTVAENDLDVTEDGYLVMWHDLTLGRLGNLVDINGYLMYTDGTNFYWVLNDIVYTYNGTDYVETGISVNTLTRCAGTNYSVNSSHGSIGLPLAILKRIDFGAYKGSMFAGNSILTFEEWVVLCKELGMEIYTDKKLTYTDALLTEAANTVKKYGMAKHASWIGLIPSEITFIRNILPGARCGILTHPTANAIAQYGEFNTDNNFFFDGDAKNGMTAEAIQLGLNAGFDVEVWYVDYASATEEEILSVIRTAVSYGVTGITTDHYRVDEAFQSLLDSVGNSVNS